MYFKRSEIGVCFLKLFGKNTEEDNLESDMKKSVHVRLIRFQKGESHRIGNGKSVSRWSCFL